MHIMISKSRAKIVFFIGVTTIKVNSILPLLVNEKRFYSIFSQFQNCIGIPLKLFSSSSTCLVSGYYSIYFNFFNFFMMLLTCFPVPYFSSYTIRILHEGRLEPRWPQHSTSTVPARQWEVILTVSLKLLLTIKQNKDTSKVLTIFSHVS